MKSNNIPAVNQNSDLKYVSNLLTMSNFNMTQNAHSESG